MTGPVTIALLTVLGWRGGTARAHSEVAIPKTDDITVRHIGTVQKLMDARGAVVSDAGHGVRIIRGGQELKPEVGMFLLEGDRVVTDGARRVLIGPDREETISVGVNSDLTLHKESATLSLGSVLLSIRRIFRVETQYVRAGVEGTEFALSVGSGDLMALIVEGRVKFESRDRKWAPKVYKTGERCIVRGDGEPKRLTQAAIRAFHRRDYETALALYDQVLLRNPENAYVLNLKAYSLFKTERIPDAIKVQKESTRVDPAYAWGFFDLARFQCAARDFGAARQSMQRALELRSDLRAIMEGDGEFRRLCAPILR